MAFSLSLALAFSSLLGAAQDPLARASFEDAAPDPVVSGWSTFWWNDYDADGLVDAFVLMPGGRGRLLKNGGQGNFEDVTEASGTAGTSGVHMALWKDFDGDGRNDLFLASYGGASRLMRQAGAGVFLDVTEQAGLSPRLDPIDAEWIDSDSDGLFDLRVTTLQGDWIFQNRGQALFETINLGIDAGMSSAGIEMPATVEEARRLRGLGASAASRPFGEEDPMDAAGVDPSDYRGESDYPGESTEEGGSCASTIEDQAAPGVCLPASSVPTLGSLFPISSQFFINATNGRVGVGTTSPGAKLDVAGGDIRTSGRLISTAASGAPLTVSSNALVTNLNADRLDGFTASDFSQLGTLIETAEIADGAVNSAKIADAGVATVDLAANAVTSAKILDATVTAADLGANSVGSAEIQTAAIGSLEIADGTIVNADVSASAAIAGTKVVPNFGSQNVVTSGSVQATNNSPIGKAVVGIASYEGSGQNYGGYFLATNSTAGIGVRAEAPTGVSGHTTTPTGVGVAGTSYSTSGSASGVFGRTLGVNSHGVHGWADTTVPGSSVGVFGQADAPYGAGVYGWASGTSGWNIGVGGESASPGGYAVYAAGNFAAAGTKNFIQPHPTDASKEIRFVCLEGNESGTYFRGSAQLLGGLAVIEVPEEFRLVSEPTNITVQVTAMGPAPYLYVESKSLEEIVVRGGADVAFDYFVNGVRRGYADFEPIGESHGYVPRKRGVPFGTQYPAAIRQMLIDNGTLNPDLTPNEATAERLGWRLVEPDTEPTHPALQPSAPPIGD